SFHHESEWLPYMPHTHDINPPRGVRPHAHALVLEVVGQYELPRPIGIHDVDVATEISRATRRKRDPAPVVRPIGTRVVPRGVGELNLFGTSLVHGEDVPKHVEAVICSADVTKISIERPPRSQ